MPKLEQKQIMAMAAPETFVPQVIRHSLQAYIEHGQPVGSFLAAVLNNDLRVAVREADITAARFIPTIVRWLEQYAPLTCWGDESSRRGWTDARARDLKLVARS